MKISKLFQMNDFSCVMSSGMSFAQDPNDGKSPTSTTDARSRKMYDVGGAFYEAGRDEAAVEAFEEAYELSQRNVLLLNIANAYERLGNLEATIKTIDRYLPFVEPENKSARIKRQELLKAQLDSGELF